ncbi:N-methyl-D-aspartate receptor NMDAR2C subunit, partial [Oceanospirillum sp. HFRX-1_2]
MERFNFSRWKLLMQQWGLAEHGPLFEMLQDAYRKEGRYYHTEFHVDACLEQLDRFRAELQNPDEVELALWFHDAVYDPFRQDNELKSAQWAQVFLQSQ